MGIISYFKKPSIYVECSDYKNGTNDRFILQRLGLFSIVSIASLFLTLYLGLQVGAIIAVCANIVSDSAFSYIVEKYSEKSYLDTRVGDKLAVHGIFWYAAISGMIEGALFGGVATTIGKASSKTRTITEVVVGGLNGLLNAAEAMHEIARRDSPEMAYRKRTKTIRDLVPTKTKVIASVAVGGITLVSVAVGVALAPFTLGAGTAVAIALGACGVTSVLSYFGISKYENRKHKWDSNLEDDVEMRHAQEDAVTEYQQIMRAIQKGFQCTAIKSYDVMGVIRTHYLEFQFLWAEKAQHFEIKVPYRALPIDKFAFMRDAIMSYRLTNKIGSNVYSELDLNVDKHKEDYAKGQLALILKKFEDGAKCYSVTHDKTVSTSDTTKNYWEFDFGNGKVIDINLKLLNYHDACSLIAALQLHADDLVSSNLTLRFIDDHLDYDNISSNIEARATQTPNIPVLVRAGNVLSHIIHPERKQGFVDKLAQEQNEKKSWCAIM